MLPVSESFFSDAPISRNVVLYSQLAFTQGSTWISVSAVKSSYNLRGKFHWNSCSGLAMKVKSQFYLRIYDVSVDNISQLISRIFNLNLGLALSS